MISIIEFTAQAEDIRELTISGLLTDGAHHKQWYLEKILMKLGIDIDVLLEELEEDDYSFERGIAP